MESRAGRVVSAGPDDELRLVNLLIGCISGRVHPRERAQRWL